MHSKFLLRIRGTVKWLGNETSHDHLIVINLTRSVYKLIGVHTSND